MLISSQQPLDRVQIRIVTLDPRPPLSFDSPVGIHVPSGVIRDVLVADFLASHFDTGQTCQTAICRCQDDRDGIAIDTDDRPTMGQRHQVAPNTAAQVCHAFQCKPTLGLVARNLSVRGLLQQLPRKKHPAGIGKLDAGPSPQFRLRDHQMGARRAQILPQGQRGPDERLLVSSGGDLQPMFGRRTDQPLVFVDS